MQATTALLQERYEIVRPIAQGGTGAVYEARDEQAGGKHVALKLCVFNHDQMRELFECEATQLTQLAHPHLPQVQGWFNEGAGQYLVMEYVPGQDLERTLQDFGQPLDHRTVLRWADQLLDALHYLHNSEPPLLHRDIKPANIKLTQQGLVKLLDFGLAKGHTGSLNQYGYPSAYAPIEQIRNSGTDPRSDLYSLGATLFRLLTGHAPENALARFEALSTTQRDPQRLATELVPTVPLMVANVIHRALALNREARFQTALEMRESLRLALKIAPPPVYASATDFEESFSAPEPPATNPSTPERETPASVITENAEPPASNQPSRPAPTEPVVISPATIFPKKPTLTMTIPLPAANLVRTRSRWLYAAVFLAVLVLGGSALGLLSKQFLGLTTAEPPAPVQPSAVSDNTPALPARFTNRFGMQFTLVPAGRFTMGTTAEPDAQPPHIVTLTEPFYLSVHEITQQQWRTLMRQDPSLHKGDSLPVENVTWFEVQKYLAQINLLNDGYRYRLPTEAEWEYAARAGQAESPEPLRSAWFNGNTAATQPVMQKEPNAFGLYDMLGNAAEWCADAYHETYAGAPTDGEAWTAATGSKLFRVIRGESWQSDSARLHAAYRNYVEPHTRSGALGFRLVAENLPESAMP